MTSEKHRPWWAAAAIGGAVTGATIVGILGAAREKAIRPAVAVELDADRLVRIESKLDAIAERVARIEGRLERK